VSSGPNEPWIFPYVEEPVQRGYPPDSDSVLRPLVEVTIVGPLDESKVAALVDSGAEDTLLAPWTLRALGLEPDPATEIELGIGGRPRKVRFCDVDLHLHSPSDPEEYVDWRTEVGVIMSQWEPPFSLVLGQRGFFDKFTVTIHRGVPAVVVEDWTAFDGRFHS
jgi:hypothetical protein